MEEFDPVDPKAVPLRFFRDGGSMPAIGMGTFGNDRFTPRQVAEAVSGAIEVGYRFFDCAAAYGNEKEIGEAFGLAFGSGRYARGDFFILSKLWNDRHGDAERACERTLSDLRLEYLDLYLIHWPFPNTHPVGAPPGYRDPGAVPYDHNAYMRTWRAMERLVERGLVRRIGTSNMTRGKLEGVLREAAIKPAANEIELHPGFQQPDFVTFHKERGVVPIAYAPLGSPSRPDRDRAASDLAVLDDPVIRRIAAARGIRPASVCLKWAVQRGQAPIPSSVVRAEYLSNLRCVCGDPLSELEMGEIARIDRNCRIIKGVVFLWKDAKDWTELWT